MGYMKLRAIDKTPYGCPTKYCSAVAYIIAQTAMIEPDNLQIWCAVACSIGHVRVERWHDLREITNLYWPTKDQDNEGRVA